MALDKWDLRYIAIAREASSWSKDPSTKVGAVVADKERRVVALGYNGFARKIEDADEKLAKRELKYEMVVHAEVNAVLTPLSRRRRRSPMSHRATSCRSACPRRSAAQARAMPSRLPGLPLRDLMRQALLDAAQVNQGEASATRHYLAAVAARLRIAQPYLAVLFHAIGGITCRAGARAPAQRRAARVATGAAYRPAVRPLGSPPQGVDD
jgi:hypothetical protein